LAPPFFDTVVSDIAVRDLGGGSVRTRITGRYLLNARVRVGTTILNAASPGFAVSNNTLEFVTTAQSLAQFGATVMASGGVDTPLALTALCKASNRLGECIPKSNLDDDSPQDADHSKKRASKRDPCYDTTLSSDRNPAPPKMKVRRVSITPASDSSSLVEVELCSKLDIEEYPYFEYRRNAAGVTGIDEERKPNLLETRLLDDEVRRRVNKLPIVIVAGGKTYGFSDLPFQAMSPGTDKSPKLSFIASNDSLDFSPLLQVQRLFGDPNLDSALVRFISPGRLRYETNFNRITPSQ
jgi:hypothetical protein